MPQDKDFVIKGDADSARWERTPYGDEDDISYASVVILRVVSRDVDWNECVRRWIRQPILRGNPYARE